MSLRRLSSFLLAVLLAVCFAWTYCPSSAIAASRVTKIKVLRGGATVKQLNITKGTKVRLKAIALDSRNRTVRATFTWTSSRTSVATVKAGTLTAKATGRTAITVRSQGRSAKVTVNVVNSQPSLSVLSLRAGLHHAGLLASDGTVFAAAIIGDSYGPYMTVNQVPGIAHAISIDCGDDACYAATIEGTVYRWTMDYQKAAPTSATLVGGISDVRAVAAGAGFALALTNSNRVYGWGKNDYFQLGDPSRQDHDTPWEIANLGIDVATIAAGSYRALALKKDGTIYMWGAPDSRPNHALVDHAQIVDSIPASAIAISAGDSSHLALLSDGTVYQWGYPQWWGQGLVPGINNPKAISAGDYLYYSAMYINSSNKVIQVDKSGQDGVTPIVDENAGLKDFNIVMFDLANYGFFLRSDGALLGQTSNDTVPLVILNPLASGTTK